MSKKLTIADIQAVVDLETREVEVPEWGGSVEIKGMSKREQQMLRKTATDPLTGQIDPDKMEAAMLAHCLSEPSVTIEQAEQLMQKSASAIDKILNAIMDITGLSDAAQKAMAHTFRPGTEGSEKTS